MSSAMEFHGGQSERLHELPVIVPIGARFGWRRIIRQDVKIFIHNFFDRANQFLQVFRHRNFPDGVFGFRSVENHLGMFPVRLYDIDALNRFSNMDHSVFDIQIVLCQRTDLPDTHSST